MEYMNEFAGIKKQYDRFCKDKLNEYDFTPNEVLVLKRLIKNPEITISRELSDKVNVSPSLISRSIDNLNKKGMILYNQDWRDRRKHIIQLNIDNNLRNILEHLDEEFNNIMFKDVKEDNIKIFDALLSQVSFNIKNI